MRKIYRIVALIMSLVIVFAIAGCNQNAHRQHEEQTTDFYGPTDEDTKDTAQETPDDITVNLHYLREDGKYDGWNVWFWTTGEGRAYEFGSEADDDGVTCSAHFEAGTKEVGFLVRLNDWDAKDYEEDRFIDTSKILAGTIDVYVISGREIFDVKYNEDCVRGVSVTSAVMSDDYGTVMVFLSEIWDENTTLAVLNGDGTEIPVKEILIDDKNRKKVTLTLEDKADWSDSYRILLNGAYKYMIEVPDFYSTEDFESQYTYEGGDLGAVLKDGETVFKVWAPMADAVSVNLYESGDASEDDLIRSISMASGENGVWEVKADEELDGIYYTFAVRRDGVTTEACDPYARAVGVNGDRAMVIDMSDTDPEGWEDDVNPNKGMNYTDAVIYETHIRDFSIDSSSGITNKGKYLGLIETGTVNSSGEATGLDHIKELGITHLQLMPVFDFATVDESRFSDTQYNWGYDPKNYNVPDGSYSTNPYDAAVRISEFKQMVKGLHDNGISVVMDVVYNHTYDSDFCYNRIVPDYFLRPDSNGSQCGNDVASERLMVRKYIVESVVYWAEEYHIDGFRFDLAGLIDVETIQEIRKALDEIDPSIMLYGEGWSLSTKTTKDYTFLATQNNISKLDNFAMFNDSIRDALKGSVFKPAEKGYINGETEVTVSLKRYIQGKVSWSILPWQQINYASCHDNMTLWDEISSSNPSDTFENRLKQNLMSAAVIYTAQGVPFILSGEEMLRTKTNADGSLNDDSYNAPDSVNSIKWDTLSQDEYRTVFNYYRGLIAFRKAHASLRSTESAQSHYTFDDSVTEGVIAYELEPFNGEAAGGIYVVHNPLSSAVTVDLPEGDWTICVQGMTAGTESLGTANGEITVEPISTTILVK